MKEQENQSTCNNCNYLETHLFSNDEGCWPECWHYSFDGMGRDIIQTNNPVSKEIKFPRPDWCPLIKRK